MLCWHVAFLLLSLFLSLSLSFSLFFSRVPWYANGGSSCTCQSYLSGLTTGKSLYCKHLLAVRLCALQGWDTLNVRHVTPSQIGHWLSEALSSKNYNWNNLNILPSMLFFFSTTTTMTRRTVHKNIFEKLYGQIMNKTFSIDLYNYECGPTLRRYIFTCVHSIFAIIILFFFSLERCNSFFSRSSFLFSVSRFKLSDMYVELLF